MSSELSNIVLRVAAISAMTAQSVTCRDFTQLRISSRWGRSSRRCCNTNLELGSGSSSLDARRTLASVGEVNLLCVGECDPYISSVLRIVPRRESYLASQPD